MLADQKELFNTFHRGSNAGTIPGTGLGMSIVKKCVDLHGGAIALGRYSRKRYNVYCNAAYRLRKISYFATN